MKHWSFGRGRGSLSSLSDMDVSGFHGARPGGLMGPQGQMQATWGSSPDRVDKLFGFCTPFRLPVYSNPEVRGDADINYTSGEGRHVIDQRGTNLTAKGPVTLDSRDITEIGQNLGATPGICEVVMASLKAM